MAKSDTEKEKKVKSGEKKEVKETKKTQDEKETKDIKEKPKKKRLSRKLVERYKKRNRLIEIIIACIVLLVVFFVLCNKTFLKTEYTKKVDSSTVTINIPRFTYYISSDENTIVFKTLRKSTNVAEYFQEFLESGAFDLYYCNDEPTFYYSSTGNFIITSIDVTKTFAVKTITVNYSTEDVETYCDTISSDEDEL